MNKENSTYRYPGANSFTTEQAHLFKGRDKDCENLYQHILGHQIVVLHGKSGYGKSSLINAGIIPMLASNDNIENFLYFSVRLFAKEQGVFYANPPIDTLIRAISQDIDEWNWLRVFNNLTYSRGRLWYWLKQQQLSKPEATIILFFDQFEELFTYSEQEIEEFASELNLVLYQRVPEFFKEKEYFSRLDNHQKNFIFSKSDIKIVFSIRSDRMFLLSRLRKYLPSNFQFNYELDALTENEARQAILEPAQLQGEEFISPSFRYEYSSIDAIINRVKNSYDGKIETTTLQIILRFIEEHKVPKLEGSPITLEVLGYINYIFKDFYQTSLNMLNNEEEKIIVSRTIEEIFIQNNQRIPFAGEYLKLEYKWTDQLLWQLEKSTLLRKERDTAGRFIYEIGHDTLIEPILEFAKIREQDVKQKRLGKNIAIVGAIALAFLFILFYLLRLTQKSEQAKEEAQKTLYQLYYQQAKTVKDNGDNFARNKDAKTAHYYYDSANTILEKIPETDSIATNLKNDLQKLLKP